MHIKFEQQIGARFKLITHNGDHTKPNNESAWSDNLVLDTGLSRMSVDTWITGLAVGTGQTPPQSNHTGLENYKYFSTDLREQQPLLDLVSDEIYYGIRLRYRFSPGQATGNISEVGMGWSPTNMWNRALVRDVEGSATTVTILPDEFLDVISEIKVYPVKEFSGSFTLRNKSGDPISTHTYVGRPNIPGTYNINIGTEQIRFGGTSQGYSYTTSISAAAMTAGYSDNGGTSTSSVENSYTNSWPTTTSTRQSIRLNLDRNNYSHKSFRVVIVGLLNQSWHSGADIGYKWEIDPPIVKTNQNTLTYSYELAWSRYIPPTP